MKTKDKVKKLLEKNSKLRDDDNKLQATYWYYELKAKGEDLEGASMLAYLTMYANGELTNAESIRRMRAKLQEEYIELRGEKYNKRHKIIQDKWRKDLGYKPGGAL